MTQPTFQELLTSQEARDRAKALCAEKSKGPYIMDRFGVIAPFSSSWGSIPIVWQGYLQEAAPPPEPRVFKRFEYRNVYSNGKLGDPAVSRYEADQLFKNQTDKGAPSGGQLEGRRYGVNRFDFEVREECWDD